MCGQGHGAGQHIAWLHAHMRRVGGGCAHNPACGRPERAGTVEAVLVRAGIAPLQHRLHNGSAVRRLGAAEEIQDLARIGGGRRGHHPGGSQPGQYLATAIRPIAAGDPVGRVRHARPGEAPRGRLMAACGHGAPRLHQAHLRAVPPAARRNHDIISHGCLLPQATEAQPPCVTATATPRNKGSQFGSINISEDKTNDIR
jgi:hypothetical protein